ncbi:MAG: apaG [Rhodocyclales bacterium]|nr:apaG [Rhodocyclales bacterium]
MDKTKYLIHVESSAEFIAEQSSPEEGRFVFAYQIRIENQGALPAKLISRHWLITDAEGRVQEVRGVGVIGEQPLIAPGESFEYTSGCSIATPVGTMRGAYQMTAEDGTDFDADIPEFMLPGPRVLH